MNLQKFNVATYDAYVELLKRPDPADLPHRGHVTVIKGDPAVVAAKIPWLARSYSQYWNLSVYGEVK